MPRISQDVVHHMDKKKTLNIALIGYGRMGRFIEQVARDRGHEIALVIDRGQEDLLCRERLHNIDVAIEFTQPEAAYANCHACIDCGVPIVSGTTGWNEGVEALRRLCHGRPNASFFWSSNFSIGVYLFTEINRKVARLMQMAPDYRVSMTETHHIHKLDAPSGTAITLANAVIDEHNALDSWILGEATQGHQLPIQAIREGETPGTHSVEYRSAADRIVLTHEAFGRRGFAFGAVLAAEYAAAHRGIHTMRDMIDGNDKTNNNGTETTY